VACACQKLTGSGLKSVDRIAELLGIGGVIRRGSFPLRLARYLSSIIFELPLDVQDPADNLNHR